MAIANFDDYLGSYKQYTVISKTNSVTTVAGQPSTLIDRAGLPAAGLLNPGNVTTGIVPTDASAGYWNLLDFPTSAKGYVSRVEANWSVPGTLALYDVLFVTGQTTIPTTGTTTVSLASQPLFDQRVPFQSDGSARDYSQVELWAYAGVAWSNHAHTLNVTYVNEAGVSARTTPNMSTQNIALNRMMRVPLSAVDQGIRRLDGYALNGATSSTGAVSIALLRKLWSGRVNYSADFGPDRTGMPEVFSSSAILMVAIPDSTSSGVPQVRIEIAQK